jgi:hypothetical protein
MKHFLQKPTLFLTLLTLLSACPQLAIQNVWIVLQNLNVSEETQITCTRAGKVTYTGKFTGTGPGNEVDTFKRSCFGGVGTSETVEVKATQAASGRTGQTSFSYSNASGSTGIETIGFYIVVSDQNAKLTVSCFTDNNLTKACTVK